LEFDARDKLLHSKRKNVHPEHATLGCTTGQIPQNSKVARVNSGYLVSLLTFGIFLIRKVNFASLFQEQVNS